jgi:Uma2 family endonuclease
MRVATGDWMPLGYSQVVMQPAMIPASMLEERRRLGHDRFDEVWDGILHMVPTPGLVHQRAATDLFIAMRTIARRRGMDAFMEFNLLDPATADFSNYRVPDVTVAAPAHVSLRGVEGRAELVVEVISPNDESRDKLPFYAEMNVQEVWLLDPKKRTIEVFRGLSKVAPDPVVGAIHAPSLGLVLSIEGETLRIADGTDMYEVCIRDTL